ncbi:hypothetical protein EYC80_009264 [Monilinia laxa]|uniref:DNA (cytosine-5-)-methyltransferase n=1 Tax=Monilinia laxa TaxID=61186 RepID=A0A5N6JX98_MONLA|nr:hypothetical protein EYC80_009264 [Monilinia laxa]
MASLSGIDFRKKFASLFQIDPSMSNSEIPKVKPKHCLSTGDKDSEDETGSTVVDDDIPISQERTGLKRRFSACGISDDPDAITSRSDLDTDSDINYAIQIPRSTSKTQNRPWAALKKKNSYQSLKTFTTPWILRIAGEIFGEPLTSIRTSDDEPSHSLALENYREAISSARNPGEKFLLQSREKLTEYRAGDNVLVQLGDVESKLYYSRIVYLFKDRDEESMAHVRYFEHGYSTMTGEIASPRELFLTYECADIYMDDVKGKIRVDFRGENDNNGFSGAGVIKEEYYTSPDRYFYRLNYNISSESFIEASELTIQERGTPLQGYECCARHIAEEKQKSKRLQVLGLNKGYGSVTGFIYNGTEYHRKDFLYFLSKAQSKDKKPYQIGQIKYIRVIRRGDVKSETETDKKEINELDIILRMDVYEQYDDYFQLSRSDEIKNNVQFAVHDERRVFLRKSKNLGPESIDGHCLVMHIDHIEDLSAYKDLNDTFWVRGQISRDVLKESITAENLKPMPEKYLTYSKQSSERSRLEKEMVESKKSGVKLSTLDIFSGADGLSQSFHESGVVGTTYAIEFDSAACKTFERNFPDAIMYNLDASKLLEWTMKKEAGLDPNVLYNMEGDLMTAMPRKGEVDLIIGGPPCQA